MKKSKLIKMIKEEILGNLKETSSINDVIDQLDRVIAPYNESQEKYSQTKDLIESILSKNGYSYERGDSKGLNKHYEFWGNGEDTIKLVTAHSPKGNVYFTAMIY